MTLKPGDVVPFLLDNGEIVNRRFLRYETLDVPWLATTITVPCYEDENMTMTMTAPGAPVPFKYNEGALIDEIRAYVEKTYKQHYVGEDNVQAMDILYSTGHAQGFTVGSIVKYATRYGKKAGRNRDDILKIIHYGILLLHEHDRWKAKQDRERLIAGDSPFGSITNKD